MGKGWEKSLTSTKTLDVREKGAAESDGAEQELLRGKPVLIRGQKMLQSPGCTMGIAWVGKV